MGFRCFSVTSATASVIGDRVGREDRVDLRLDEEPLVDGDRRRGVRLIVLGRELDLATEDTALFVRMLDAELVAALNGLAEVRRRCRCWRTTPPILIGGWASALAAAPNQAETQRQPQGRTRRRLRMTMCVLLISADSTAASGNAACPARAPPATRSPSCRPATGTAPSCGRSGIRPRPL